MDVCFIEFWSDIQNALKLYPNKNCLFISVSAEASYYLQKIGIEFITDEDILNPREFIEIGDENFKIAQEWVEGLEQYLERFSLKIENVYLRPFKWHFYRLKSLLDAVRVRKIIVDRIIEKESPGTIGAPEGVDPFAVHDASLFFYKADSLYGTLVDKIALKNNINVVNWRTEDREIRFVSGGETTRDRIKKINLSRILEVIEDIIHLVHRPNRNVLISTSGYDIGPLWKKLSNKFKFYFSLNPGTYFTCQACILLYSKSLCG